MVTSREILKMSTDCIINLHGLIAHSSFCQPLSTDFTQYDSYSDVSEGVRGRDALSCVSVHICSVYNSV